MKTTEKAKASNKQETYQDVEQEARDISQAYDRGINEFVLRLRKLRKRFPNDQEFGRKVSQLINK